MFKIDRKLPKCALLSLNFFHHQYIHRLVAEGIDLTYTNVQGKTPLDLCGVDR